MTDPNPPPPNAGTERAVEAALEIVARFVGYAASTQECNFGYFVGRMPRYANGEIESAQEAVQKLRVWTNTLARAATDGDRSPGPAPSDAMLRAVISQFAHPNNWSDQIGNLQWVGKRHAMEWAQSLVLQWDPEATWPQAALVAPETPGAAVLAGGETDEWLATRPDLTHAGTAVQLDEYNILVTNRKSTQPHTLADRIAALERRPEWTAEKEAVFELVIDQIILRMHDSDYRRKLHRDAYEALHGNAAFPEPKS